MLEVKVLEVLVLLEDVLGRLVEVLEAFVPNVLVLDVEEPDVLVLLENVLVLLVEVLDLEVLEVLVLVLDVEVLDNCWLRCWKRLCCLLACWTLKCWI